MNTNKQEHDPLSEQSLMADVHTITGFGWRRNGSPAALRTASFFREQFERKGLATTVESWPFNLYYPQEWSLTGHPALGTGDDVPWQANSIPIWYSAPGAVRGKAVYIDARTGSPDLANIDITGKVLLVDVSYIGNFSSTDGSPVRDHGLYAAAVKRGAAGYVRRAGAPGNAVMLMHFAQNFPTHKGAAQLGAIPAFTVGQTDFDRLAETAKAGLEIELSNVLTDVPKGEELVVTGGSLGPGEHRLRAIVDDVVGVLPGLTDEIIIVAAHYDSTFDGAVDNATGNAVLLGLMRHYAALPVGKRAKTMVFLASGAHDTGDFDLYHFVEKHEEDLLPRTVAFNWLDHMAAGIDQAAPGNTVAHGVIAAENELLRSHITEHMAAFGVPVEPVLGPASTISHLPPYVPSYNVTLAPSWYHSPEDTAEKVPRQALAAMAAAQRSLLDTLMSTKGSDLRAANQSATAIAAATRKTRAAGGTPAGVPSKVTDGVFFSVPPELPHGRHRIARDLIENAHRERLMIAATELLASKGYRDFGIREICKDASVSQTAFYVCYEDKDACIFAAYQRFIDVLTDQLTASAEPQDRAIDTIAAFVENYVDALQRDLVTARAFQVEMETLGYPARSIRRRALAGLAHTLAYQLAHNGIDVSKAATLSAVYAMRQTVSDALDEQTHPDLLALVPETTGWVTRMIHPDASSIVGTGC
ncbi:M28 family peptidase [Arthrobacter sp. SLBN-112]|uniref:M28 family peptidase n=1 Tax=Arthrobacter sp. SLBN-112 TaxID=2768452 RepID=UPI0027B53375|nr:M28 family peptidase [Arthrobacter sp. SLBN-112]MDQ0801446.1 AcrR family transcriptional regulator [Arthrobacter sp. SLBN-112]